ncbi:GNAT family N-acetyltransferase [Actinoplanes sp. NPDC051343]|uniref:GNAT family N-acetyltransferase n=1 Tax=Actinoplanes sp. NPDC051343 TaxID=3363906 RepID=UPI0037B121CA
MSLSYVNISYAVHPWARGRGVAVEAVRLILEHIREHRVGTRAAVRIDPNNIASVRVAKKSSFTKSAPTANQQIAIPHEAPRRLPARESPRGKPASRPRPRRKPDTTPEASNGQRTQSGEAASPNPTPHPAQPTAPWGLGARPPGEMRNDPVCALCRQGHPRM